MRLDDINEVGGEVFIPVNDDVNILAEELYGSGETARSADRIKVAESVPHDEDVVRMADNVFHSVCDDTGL